MSTALLPDLRIALIAPDLLLNEREFIRVHNRVAKQSLHSEAIYHWAKRIPQHFMAGAASKYGYKPRRPMYKKIKKHRYGNTLDLVRTGETRDSILRDVPQVRIGGKAANSDGTTGQLRLTMTMRLPFGVDAQQAVAKSFRTGKYSGTYTSGTLKPGVTIADMKREIAAITTDEASEISDAFGKRYIAYLKNALRTRPKIRKRIVAEHFGSILGF